MQSGDLNTIQAYIHDVQKKLDAENCPRQFIEEILPRVTTKIQVLMTTRYIENSDEVKKQSEEIESLARSCLKKIENRLGITRKV